MEKKIFADEMEKNQMLNLLNEYYNDTVFGEKTIESYEVDPELYGLNPDTYPKDFHIIQRVNVFFTDGTTSWVEYWPEEGKIY